MECIGQDSQRSRAKPMEHQQILRSVLGEVLKLGHSDGCERPRCWRANLGQTHEQHATGCRGPPDTRVAGADLANGLRTEPVGVDNGRVYPFTE